MDFKITMSYSQQLCVNNSLHKSFETGRKLKETQSNQRRRNLISKKYISNCAGRVSILATMGFPPLPLVYLVLLIYFLTNVTCNSWSSNEYMHKYIFAK